MIDSTVRGGSLASRSPVGCTGACGHLRTQTRQEQSKGGYRVPGARLPKAWLEIAELRFPRPLPSGSFPHGSAECALRSLKGGACWQPTGCVITSRRELGSPRGPCGMMAGAEAPQPQKRYYRQRAHSNPMADHTLC